MQARPSRQLGNYLGIALSLCIALVSGIGIFRLAANTVQPQAQSYQQLGSPAAAVPTLSSTQRQAVLGLTDQLAEQATAAPTPFRTTTSDLGFSVPAPASRGVLAFRTEPLLRAVPNGGTVLPSVAGQPFVNDTFDAATSGWLDQTTARWSAYYEAGGYHLALNGQATISVSAPISADSYQLTADIAINLGEAGLIFMAAEPDTLYSLMLDGDGRYAVQAQPQDRNEIRYVVDWTFHSALRGTEGIADRLRIEREGQQLRFFANDQLLTSWLTLDEQIAGHYGFTAWASDGQAAAVFDNLLGQQLPTASAR